MEKGAIMFKTIRKSLVTLIAIMSLINSVNTFATNGDQRIGLNATQSGMGKLQLTQIYAYL